MAEIRPLAFPQLQTPAASPAKAEAIRAAQRAFFQAAMDGTTAPAPAAQPSAPAAAPIMTAPAPVNTDRYLRPGSRLDIKV